MAPKISIITPTFNSSSVILDNMRSVRRQAYRDWEQIIVDGASTDDTLARINTLPPAGTKVISEPDNGIYDAMNKGIALATGDIVGFLNSDDFYAHDQVLATIASIMADTSVDACYADLDYVDKCDTQKIKRVWRSQPYHDGLFEKGWMPAHPTFYVRRDILRRSGGFDLAFPRQADFELCMRLMAKNRIKARYCNDVWVKMRTGGTSNNSVAGILKGNLEAYRACRKNRLQVNVMFIPVKILSRIPQFVAAFLQRQAS
ncbi:glycosyltransferase involved in cell wall biosynthesis [Rhizobium aethiopicum]|uniref:Glycosyltransferase involved in cell wall biosynthesis n=1 Tax=Rhizobium aethiopicum TaxID=1138170 RepID=A0A7W6QD18_9HYPH|nr:glycosyltransferase family 2 protein [Rhizobium aethiopicum]MBB4195291.1 glycosyltransferase involved in cell wall biosynthesis [Rhizobium aethiopicum]MBB4584021.1 glycosyltransferase involved in cell wall biosynthesis [Rhizobium aethiopicum]